jgi:hypothetical protein
MQPIARFLAAMGERNYRESVAVHSEYESVGETSKWESAVMMIEALSQVGEFE